VDENIIRVLIKQYADALEDDSAARIRELDTKRQVEHTWADLISLAYLDGRIDGKNAEIRNAQEHDILRESEAYQTLAALHHEAMLSAIEAASILKLAEMECSLYRAFLYQNTRIG